MTNIVSTASNLDHTSDAGFRAWVAEIITALFTTLTLTQTSDTGQINTSTVSRPAQGSSPGTPGGYIIFRFNDTAQATSPIFIKLEFGTNVQGTGTRPCMWVTVGTGSNGSGTLTGTTTIRAAVTTQSDTVGPTATYVSLFVYNATQGFFSMMWKSGALGSLNTVYGGIILSRTTDSTGAATTDAYVLVTNSVVNGGLALLNTQGNAQGYSYLTSSLVTTVSPTAWSGGYPYSNGSTLYGGNIQVAPCWQSTPVYGVNANFACALLTEIPAGVTISLALVGTPVLNFVSAGNWFSNANPGGCTGGTILILWQ